MGNPLQLPVQGEGTPEFGPQAGLGGGSAAQAEQAEAAPPDPGETAARHIMVALGGGSGHPMDWARGIIAGGLSAGANVGTVPSGGGALTGITRAAGGLRQQGREAAADQLHQQQVQQEMQLKQKADARAEQELQIHMQDTKVQRALWTAQIARMTQEQNAAAEALEERKKLFPGEYAEQQQKLKENQDKIDQAHGEMLGIVRAAGINPEDSPLVKNSSDLTTDHAKQAASGMIFPLHNGESHAAGEDNVGVYLMNGNVWDMPIQKPVQFTDSSGKEHTAQPGTTVAELAGIEMGKMKYAHEQTQQILDKLNVPAKKAQIAHEQAATEHEKAATELERSQISSGPQQDILGGTFTPPAGGIKEANKVRDSFKKDADNLAKTEGTFNQFQDILRDINAGKDMTGAQSVVALFNAIGISAEPLQGKGFRINHNTVEEHEEARGFGESLYQKFLKLKKGDVITPQQVKDYAEIASRSRRDAYVNKINEVRSQGINPDFLLPRGNGRRIDTNTAQIFYDAASGNNPQEKAANAKKAAQATGWQF